MHNRTVKSRYGYGGERIKTHDVFGRESLRKKKLDSPLQSKYIMRLDCNNCRQKKERNRRIWTLHHSLLYVFRRCFRKKQFQIELKIIEVPPGPLQYLPMYS